MARKIVETIKEGNHGAGLHVHNWMASSKINEFPTWLEPETHLVGQPMHVPSLPMPIVPLSMAWGWPVMTNSNINKSPTWLKSLNNT